jgi:iron complex outermembrane receptor protein
MKVQYSARSARQSLVLSASVAALAVSFASVPAFADNTIETVTVTAEKRTENVQTVPLSIVAVSGQTLADAGVQNATQLGKVVPNLQITTVAQSAGVIVRVRGFGAGSNAAIDPDVAPYIDTAYIPHPGAILSSFLDVSTVEVLRGPQGTLFGRNAAMGAISITTNAPDLEKQSYEASAEIGTYGWFQGEGIVNVPVSDDAAVRVAGLAGHTNGYFHDVFDGKNYGERDQFVGRISGKWDITNDLTWTLRLDGANQNGDGLNPAQVDIHSASAAQITHFAAILKVFGATPPTFTYPPSFTLNERRDNPKLVDSQWGITSDLSWNANPDLQVRLVNSYRDWNDRQTDGDVVFTTLDLLNRHQSFSSNSQSHELQFITPKDAFLDGKLGFTAGLYYYSENYDLEEVLDLGSQFCPVATAGKPPAVLALCNAKPHISATQAPFTQQSESYAVYAQANYAILPNLELNLGARQTWDNKSGTYQQIVLNPVAAALRAPEGPDALKFKDSRPSWLANLSWHVTDTVMAFATYATGYKSGGFNSAPGAVALTPTTRKFASETSDDIELGVKSLLWDGRLLLNANLFNTEMHNFQDRSFNGLGFVIRNSGSVRSRGVETEGQVRALDNLNLDFGLAYLDGIYTNNKHAPPFDGCSPLIITPACPLTQDLSGKVLPFAAKWQGNAGFELNSDPLFGGFTATFAMKENFTSSYQAENTDSPQSIVAGFGTTDARLSLYSPNNGWQLDLTGSNIFNKHYFTEFFPQTIAANLGLNNTTTGATVFRGFLGDPATVRLKLSVHF